MCCRKRTAVLLLTLLLTGCTHEQAYINFNNEKKQQINPTEQMDTADNEADDVTDMAKHLEDLTYQDNELPNEIINLNFKSLLFDELEPIDIKNNSSSSDDWTFVKSISFGHINQQAATLQLYSIDDNIGTNQRIRIAGILDVANINYYITDLAPEIMSDNLSCNVVCVYQKFFSDQQQYELIGTISLLANGPGLKKYVIYDTINKDVLSFEAWGSPYFIDINNDNIEEFVIQFEGLHQSPPDVSIIDYIDNELKSSRSIFDHVEKHEGEYAILQLDKEVQPSIYISNRIKDENQIFGYNYSYNKGKLKLIEQ